MQGGTQGESSATDGQNLEPDDDDEEDMDDESFADDDDEGGMSD